MTRLRPILAVLLSLLLLGAQQCAFAHMIGHIGLGGLGGVPSAAATCDHGGSDKGDELGLSHVCTTCVALSALTAAPPAPAPLVPLATADNGPPLSPQISPRVGAAFCRYRARAPPALL